MSRRAISWTAFALSLCTLFAPAVVSQTPSGKDVVAPEAFVSHDPVARGMSFQVVVEMKIRPGFHVNAREVTQDYLIPTDLRVEVPAGFKLGTISYPKGTLKTFSFSRNNQLNVYTGSVNIRLPLTVLATAPIGAQHLPMKLHYQACSNEICLPPVAKDVDATINVVANRSAAKPANSQIFH
ncbi:MAG TPA: protein-disulfide reductase DsbD N-terminal domain-containing protein [Candidatus Eisenbacteria bacterium]|nr:protein-disulfide reductase DsbD N-terminal domain-containing protein [Candidatus Eisenbacteria bacterium]